MRYKPQPQWLLLQDDRERALRKRALQNTEKLRVGTKELRPLKVHDTVQVQNQVGNHPSRWDITGVIVETRPFDQYVVKIHGSGRLTTRNRKFLRQISPYCPAPKLPQPVRVQKPASSDLLPVLENPPQQVVQDSTRDNSDDTTNGLDASAPSAEPDAGIGNPLATEPDAPGPVQNQLGLRRSTRTSREPVRLQIKSWKGQSYEAGSSPMSERDITAGQSVAYIDCLHPVRPDGGEGIYDGELDIIRGR